MFLVKILPTYNANESRSHQVCLWIVAECNISLTNIVKDERNAKLD